MAFLRKLAGAAVFVAFLLGGLELALRLAPGALIPLNLLKRFGHDVRIEVATRLGVRNESMMQEVPRDDGGPRLFVYRPGAELVWDYKDGKERGETRMDEQGFCKVDREGPARERIDLFTLGDSFTACTVIDPAVAWASQLAGISGLSVYNLGFGGIGPYEYLQILKRWGLPNQPRYVVMNLYEGNDIRDADRYHQHVAAAREGRVLYRNAGDRDDQEFDYDRIHDNPVGRSSYAVNLLVALVGKGYESGRNAILRAVGDADVQEEIDFHYTFAFPEGAMPFNVQNADESEVRYARRIRRGEVAFDRFDAVLESFARLAREHGFTPVLAVSPSAYTVYADFVRFDDPELTELMPWFSRTQREYLRAAAGRLDIPFVDLTAPLQEAARERRGRELLYFPINVHYTAAGHRVVAETLAKVIAGREERASDRVR